jgi:ATP-dependent exoDNAse (exonuclease V) beta subunit
VVDKIYEHVANGVKFGDITVMVRGFKNTTFIKRLKYEIVRRKALGQQEIPYDVQTHKDVLKSPTVKYMLALFGYFLKRQLRKPVQNYIKAILKPIAAVGERD